MTIKMSNPKDGQSRWSYSAFSRVKEANLEGAIQHVCMRIPRDAFRQSAMCFNEISQSSTVARYWEMMLQLFLEMCRSVNSEIDEGGEAAQNIGCYPFQKVYLEWIPAENDDQRACEYRLHAFLLTEALTYGHNLNKVLSDNNRLHAESGKMSGNSRKPDPLSALPEHQHYKRVTKEVYYRTICGLANGHRRVENNLDMVMSHGTTLKQPGNIANPINIWTVDNACINCKNTQFKDKEENYMNGTFAFANTKRVIRLSPEQLVTKTFCHKYLPDYQSFVDSFTKPTHHVELPGDIPAITIMADESHVNIVGKDKPARENDDRLDMMTLDEYDVRTVSEQEAERIEAFSSRSDFQNLSETAKRMYIANCEEYEGKPEFCKAYYTYQQWAMKEFKSRCLNPDANISEKGKVFIRWAAGRNPPRYKILRKYDRTLSLFANRVIKIMEEAEQYFLISTAHREFYLIMHARLDAYRRNFGLHLNIFQTGEGATSKSFLFDLMKSNSVSGTIDQLTYETAKSNAVDGNRNDTITVCHEAPPGMFNTSKNKNIDSSAEAMFKERLTSNFVSCKTFYMDEATGKRSQRTTKSECIGVWMGATNDDPTDVEEALKTRFCWGNFEKTKRPGKDIDDCINGERALSRVDRLAREEVKLEWKEEQYRVFLLEKMIWCGQIKNVEMTAFFIVKQKFKKMYDGQSVREAETRDWERIFIFARIQAICTALTAVFQVKGGEYYEQPFDEDQLLAVEPYLVCTEEMVFFTLTLMDSQFVHPAEHKILNKVYHMKKKQSSNRFGTPIPEEENAKLSYDYIKCAGNISSNAKVLQQQMSGQEGKTSLHNIHAFLQSLTRMSIETYHYAEPEEALDWPKAIKTDSNGRKVKKHRAMSAHFTVDAIYIHVGLILNHSGRIHDPVMDTIKKITHKYQKTKRIMLARRWVAESSRGTHVQKYRVFKVITKEPNANNLVKYGNVLYNSDVSKSILGMTNEDSTRKTKEVIIDKDFDQWAFDKRMETLGRPIMDYEERGIDESIPTINYPTCMHRFSLAEEMSALNESEDDDVYVAEAVGVKRKIQHEELSTKRARAV